MKKLICVLVVLMLTLFGCMSTDTSNCIIDEGKFYLNREIIHSFFDKPIIDGMVTISRNNEGYEFVQFICAHQELYYIQIKLQTNSEVLILNLTFQFADIFIGGRGSWHERAFFLLDDHYVVEIGIVRMEVGISVYEGDLNVFEAAFIHESALSLST